jgi:hypothetical protein
LPFDNVTPDPVADGSNVPIPLDGPAATNTWPNLVVAATPPTTNVAGSAVSVYGAPDGNVVCTAATCPSRHRCIPGTNLYGATFGESGDTEAAPLASLNAAIHAIQFVVAD